MLKNKLKNHDSKVQEVDLDREALNMKILELESLRESMKNHINTLEENGKTHSNRLYDDYQIRIAELEADTKIKDSRIKQL